MVEVSRDGRRVYLTNSLYASWDAQFYPAGINGWATKLDADPNGGMTVDPDFFVDFARASARTRSGSRAATRRPTRTATRASATASLLPWGHVMRMAPSPAARGTGSKVSVMS